LTESRPKARDPKFMAILFRKGPDDFVLTAIAHAEDAPSSNGRSAVAAAKSSDSPGKRWAVLRPFLKQASLLGNGVPVGALPLRPIVGQRARHQECTSKDAGYRFRMGHRFCWSCVIRLNANSQVNIDDFKSTLTLIYALLAHNSANPKG